MSETVTRLPWAEARAIADELVALLTPFCSRIEVCGSIRRQTQTCGDIDLVAVPRVEMRRTTEVGLFGEIHTMEEVDLLDRRLDELWRDRVIEQRINKAGNASWGTQSKRGIFRGLNVDINAVDAEVLGMWMVIRTGPSGYSHAFVTPRSQKAALRNREGEIVDYRRGMLPPGFTVEKGKRGEAGFRLHRAHLFVPTPDESDVYKALGWRYPAPETRR